MELRVSKSGTTVSLELSVSTITDMSTTDILIGLGLKWIKSTYASASKGAMVQASTEFDSMLSGGRRTAFYLTSISSR